MKDEESKVPWDEEVEITDLESPDQTSNSLVSQTVVRFVQRVHSSSKKPIIFAFLISILVLLPAIQSGSSANGTAYILASDGTLEAHRAVDGMLLWQHQTDVGISPATLVQDKVIYVT